jgi:D-3-phosphoglycerate dehydrogenase
MSTTPRILLTHTPEARGLYYGARALSGLRALGEVVLHEGHEPFGTAALIAAARSCQIIVADRATPCPAELFAALPELMSVSRVAMDIRNIDVEAASAHGVLVTNASRSWVAAVSELAIGLMIDVARGVSRVDATTKAGKAPDIGMGRQLAGSTVGIIGYGFLGRRVAELALAFGMRVLVSDPYVTVDQRDIEQVAMEDLLRRADFVLPLAVATDETENLIGRAQLALMQPHAYLVNLSRGNLVDEAALEAALTRSASPGRPSTSVRAPDQMPFSASRQAARRGGDARTWAA